MEDVTDVNNQHRPFSWLPDMPGFRPVVPVSADAHLRRRPRQARAQERVERILDTAEQVFAEMGFGSATTNQIAQQAGTSIGSLYEFFPNKEALARALADRYITRIGPVYDTLLVDEPSLLGSDLVIRIVESLDQYFREHPGAIPVLNGRLTSPELAAAGERLQGAMVAGIDRLLAVRRPDIAAEHRITVASVIAEVTRSMLVMADQVPLSRRRVVVRETERLVIGYLMETLGEPPGPSLTRAKAATKRA
jgi:AcrR family transcriptional regulator